MTSKFLTPDEPVNPGSFYILLTLPKSVEFRQLLKGALVDLTQPEKWQEFGSMTAEDAAEAWSSILATVRDMPMHEVGSFVYSIREENPANWIPCNGSVLPMADWPELMAVYPAVLKNVPTTGQFFVPDLRGRVMVGSGVDAGGFNWPFLSTGGARRVTLTSDQMPAHSHTEITAVAAVINGGLEAPAAAAVPGAGVTGSAGGGQSHENMPPYGVLKIFLVGRLFP